MNERNQTFGTYCGRRTGISVHVTGNYAIISFQSDGSYQYRGYELLFSFVPTGRESAFALLLSLFLMRKS